jgi:ankyrin repeat protein
MKKFLSFLKLYETRNICFKYIGVENKFDIFKKNIEDGLCSVDELNNKGISILTYAIYLQDYDKTLYLLEHGAKLNKPNKTKNYPIHSLGDYFYNNNNISYNTDIEIKILKLLIDYNVDLTVKSNANKDFFDFLSKEQFDVIVKLFPNAYKRYEIMKTTKEFNI